MFNFLNLFKLLLGTQLFHFSFTLTTLLKGNSMKCVYKNVVPEDELKFSFTVSSSDQDSVRVVLSDEKNNPIYDSDKEGNLAFQRKIGMDDSGTNFP